MKLTLKRIDYREDGIISHLLDESGTVIATTLEHSYDKKPKLYNGEFKCIRGTHCLHGGQPFETFEITGVKGHTGILFHSGNWNKDSDGCVLVGDKLVDSDQGSMVTNSRASFAHLMSLMQSVETFQLMVV